MGSKRNKNAACTVSWVNVSKDEPMQHYSLSFVMLCFLLNFPLLAMDKKLLDDSVFKLKVEKQKIEIPCTFIKECESSFLNNLMMNHYKSGKRKRISLKCSKTQFDLAYLFMSKKKMPSGYSETEARQAADFFGLQTMHAYIDKHPPKLSAHLTITRYKNCPHCGRRLDGNLEAARHLIDWHDAIIATTYRFKEQMHWEMSYQIPTPD